LLAACRGSASGATAHPSATEEEPNPIDRYRYRTYVRTAGGEFVISTVSYIDFRQHLAKYMDEVWESRAPLRVTRQNARPVIVLSEAEYEGVMETLHLLQSPANADRLRRSIKSAEAGEVTEREVVAAAAGA
jgi:antitoxin YefM